MRGQNCKGGEGQVTIQNRMASLEKWQLSRLEGKENETFRLLQQVLS